MSRKAQNVLPSNLTCVEAPSDLALPNVLASRYASPDMVGVWSPSAKVVLERELWLAVLRAQRDLGVDVPEEAISAYEAVIANVDLASIAERERTTRHDVKARIEEFSALAGFEHLPPAPVNPDTPQMVISLLNERIVRNLDALAAGKTPDTLEGLVDVDAGY